ncbi:MAG: hypothetical protein AAF789_06975, partial [Bacteroidota bacterium]
MRFKNRFCTCSALSLIVSSIAFSQTPLSISKSNFRTAEVYLMEDLAVRAGLTDQENNIAGLLADFKVADDKKKSVKSLEKWLLDNPEDVGSNQVRFILLQHGFYESDSTTIMRHENQLNSQRLTHQEKS